MSNSNKRLLLILAALFVLVLIPASFASDIDDASAVGVDNQSAVDIVSLPATDDVAVESVSAADDGSASDESDALKANDYENDVIAAEGDAIYVDGFDGSGGSGTSDNPYHSLQNTMVSANSGKEIRLLPGTYDFGGTTVDPGEGNDFTLTAMGDVVFTSVNTLFERYGICSLTFNGIKFKDITSSSSSTVFKSDHQNKFGTTLNFNNCSFINNIGQNLILSSADVNIKGCIFIDNEATGNSFTNGGLIQNYYSGSTVINISYSVFINNTIQYSNNGFNSIIVDWLNNPGPYVYFDYNFVNNNDPLTQQDIVYSGVLNSYSCVNLTVTAPSDVDAGDTVDFVVNFTKSDGSPLDDSMPTLALNFIALKNAAPIPVVISNNSGKAQYTAKISSYNESVNLTCDEYVLADFTFAVHGDHELINPELTVPESLIVEIYDSVDINAAHVGDGVISYVIKSGSEFISIDGNTVTGVGVGTAVVTVSVSETDTYDFDKADVTVTVKSIPVYVDAFNGMGGRGTVDDPYHSLIELLTSSDELYTRIYLLPGTYDFGGTTVALYDRDMELEAIGDVVFTSSATLFNKPGASAITFNGIQFKDITSTNTAILSQRNSVIGTLNFNNCSFINNTGQNLILSSCNLNIKGCTFIDNEATGTLNYNGGLIENYWSGNDNITISYSIFIDNIIRYSNNEFNPIIVDYGNNPGPYVYFDYNIVDNNKQMTQDDIVYHGILNSYSSVALNVTAPYDISVGDTIDLAVNFTKSDGSALDDYMPTFTVILNTTQNAASVPLTITNNGGKGQYTAKSGESYTEIGDVSYGEHIFNTFEFYVSFGGLLNPRLTVPASLVVDIGAAVSIDATHVGDGAVSYVSSNESVATVDANGVVTGVNEGIATVTVSIAATDTYGEDSKQVMLVVKDPADGDAIYVDGFDGTGGRGYKFDPYHSLKSVLVKKNSGKEIRLLPGTYDFTSFIDLGTNTFILNAVGDDVIFTTHNRNMFKCSEECNVDFNGINFMDSIASSSVISSPDSSYSYFINSTLSFNNCNFINNTGTMLIYAFCNLNIKGCNFIGNTLTGQSSLSGGIIHTRVANNINITYSNFINNNVRFTYNGVSSIIVSFNSNPNNPNIIFNYNLVDNNKNLTDNEIAYRPKSITKEDYTIFDVTAPSEIDAGSTVDLAVNFTKSDGSPLDEYMPILALNFITFKTATSIPVVIANNSGKAQYTAKANIDYNETINLTCDENVLTTFKFKVNGDYALINPELSAPKSLSVYKGSPLDINATHVGDGVITYAVKSGSEYISLEGNTVTGVAVGTAVVHVHVSETTYYDFDDLDVTVNVLPVPIYVDGFDGDGGSGTIDDPYHSLKDVMSDDSYECKEIYILPGTYDFGGSTIDLCEKDLIFNAMGDVIFTSSETLFDKYGEDVLTFNGIQFKDISSFSSILINTGSSFQGTMILNNCSFINNVGNNLMRTSYDVYIKGCVFIDNVAAGPDDSSGGLINNIFNSPVINISYSIFINNTILFTENNVHSIVVQDYSGNPSVYFDYNFVDNNDPLTQDEIVCDCNLISSSSVNLTVAMPSQVAAGDTVDLMLNFTKSDGEALDESMPTLDVSLVPNVNAGVIPVTIANNRGNGQYTTKTGVSYRETIDVKHGESVLNTIEFYVSDGGKLNPELSAPESMIVDMGAGVNINATHIGDGIVSYVSSNESVATVDADGVVTGVGEGIATVTVSIASTDSYGEDTRQVKVMVKDPANGDAIYVDGFYGTGGSGIKVDPYHSLRDVLVTANSGKEIRVLPGKYDFISTIDLMANTFVINAVGDDVVFTTYSDYMFEVFLPCNVTFNGIKFKDSISTYSVISGTISSAVGDLSFINCDFINNTGYSLIKSSCNVNIKGCRFIDNIAYGTDSYNAGLIQNHYTSSNTINISYSIFINNVINLDYYGHHPIIVDYENGNGPAVIFNYNFVNDNSEINEYDIVNHENTVVMDDYTIITASAPEDVHAGDTVDLVVNFTKSDGSALDDYMPDLDVLLVPTVKVGPIPVTITNNSGKGQYAAKKGDAYNETVDVVVNQNYAVTSFEFDIAVKPAPEINVSAENTFGNDVIVTVTSNDELAYRVNVTVGNQSKLLRLKEGKGSIRFTGLERGTYTVTALYKGDQNYASVSANTSVEVMKPVPENFAVSAVNTFGNDVVVSVTCDDVLAYRVNVTLGNESKLVRIKDGMGSAKFTGLANGNYTVTAIYKGDENHSSVSVDAFVEVGKDVPENFAVSAVNTFGNDVVVSVTCDDVLAYRVNVTLGNESKLVRIKDGMGSVRFTGLANGNYTVTAIYKGDENYSAISVDTTVEVMSNAPNLTVSADSVYYGDDLVVNVKSTDELAYRVNVTVGNQSKLVRIKDGMGIVKFSDLEVGNYTVKAVYKGDENYSAVSVDTNVEVIDFSEH